MSGRTFLLAVLLLSAATGQASAAAPADLPRLFVICPDSSDASLESLCEQVALELRRLGRYDVVTAEDLGTIASLAGQPAPEPPRCAEDAPPTCGCPANAPARTFVLRLRPREKKDQHFLAGDLARCVDGKQAASAEVGYDPDDEPAETSRQLVTELDDATARSAEARPELAEELSIAESDALLEPRRVKWTWLMGGLTLATGIAAALVSAEAASQEDKLHDAIAASRGEPQAASIVMDHAEKADNQSIAANVLWGVTAALAIGTGVMLYFEYFEPPPRSGEAEPRRITVVPAVGPDGAAAVSLTGSF